jgi:chemotaxis signal transduction protein
MENQIISGLNSFLIFQLGPEKFAVNIGHVKKILEMTAVTKVPHTPDSYLGIINLFGEVLPVIDGRTKFGLEKKDPDVSTCIVVVMIPLDAEVYHVGFVVDQVLQVIDIAAENLSASPEIGKKFKLDFVRSVAKVKDEFILVLEVEKLFGEVDLTAINTDL